MRMTDEEFVQLQIDLAEAEREKERLQKLYKSQTGVRWVPGSGIRKGGDPDAE